MSVLMRRLRSPTGGIKPCREFSVLKIWECAKITRSLEWDLSSNRLLISVGFNLLITSFATTLIVVFLVPGDLSRYFGGEVDIPSVQAHSLEFYEEAGQLSKMSVDEDAIKPINRIPRVTSATWFVHGSHYSVGSAIDTFGAQEIRERCRRDFDPRRGPPGHELRLRA